MAKLWVYINGYTLIIFTPNLVILIKYIFHLKFCFILIGIISQELYHSQINDFESNIYTFKAKIKQNFKHKFSDISKIYEYYDNLLLDYILSVIFVKVHEFKI